MKIRNIAHILFPHSERRCGFLGISCPDAAIHEIGNRRNIENAAARPSANGGPC
jgi:hypothetical protein